MSLKKNNEKELGKWIEVKPIHCHQRLSENTLVSKLRVVSADKVHAELLLKFKHEKLKFFFDHEIDHLPGMLEACALRQCALALSHILYDIPMEHVSLLNWINIKLYNYGELNTETIVKSELLDMKKERYKTTFVLEGLMLQDEHPIMRMRGEMLAFDPKFAKRIRNKKFKLEDFKEKTASQKPLIAELHIMIKRAFWTKAYSEIISVLTSLNVSEYSVTPLYVTYDTKDTELRICFEFKDPSLVDKFVVNKIRSISGVESTRVRLTLDGQIFPKGVKTLASADSPYESCHIFLKTDPAKDKNVWNGLCALQDTEAAFPTWIFRDFYEHDRDITLRIMGKGKDEIKQYMNKYVSKIDGILDYKMQYMSKIEKIANDDKLMALATQWLKTK